MAILDREPFLLVLDGLERILLAYARMDAARLADDDLDEQTANVVAGALGLPESAAQSFTGQHRLRKTADPRAGNFLRRLANVRAARILVSTRLYPADLQMVTGGPMLGSSGLFLPGLTDDDALDLWRAFGVSGSRDTLLPLFHSFGNYPLLIPALAGEVANYHRAPGDFDQWRKNNPKFNPFRLVMKRAKSHVLEYALQGLSGAAKKVLHTIAAFRMPATYDTLADLLIGDDRPFDSEQALDTTLTELEDRGLLGWDKRANRYDLHPIVRGVTWSGLDDMARQGVYATLQIHFEAMPTIDEDDVNSLEDLTPTIELYNTLIGLGRYDDAGQLFYERLQRATHFRLSASRQRIELLEMLFPDSLDSLPRLGKTGDQAFTLAALAHSYRGSGQPGRAVPLIRRQIAIDEQQDDRKNLSRGLCNLSETLLLSGALRESETSACRALIITRERDESFLEAYILYLLGPALAACGVALESDAALRRSLRMFITQNHTQLEGAVNASLAQGALWFGDPGTARPLADRAWKLAHDQRYERDFIRAAQFQGAAAVGLGDFATGDEHLYHALTRARAVNLVEEELAALIALAELRRQQNDPNSAREFLDDVWESAERGPYPLFHADALNVLAQIERDAGNHEAAVKAATEAYRKAWCDGPPFAYHWGLEKARVHLRELGAPEPDMPPFDESKYEPMPDVEIDPPDEFHDNTG